MGKGERRGGEHYSALFGKGEERGGGLCKGLTAGDEVNYDIAIEKYSFHGEYFFHRYPA